MSPRQAMGSVPPGTDFFYFNRLIINASAGITLGEFIPTLKSVSILHSSTQSISELQTTLRDAGYDVLPLVSSKEEFFHAIQTLKPHLILITTDISVEELLIAIRNILSLRTTAVVLYMHEWDASIAKQMMNAGASGYLLKPLDRAHISATLEMAWHHFHKLMSLQDNLELRKLIEKAKGILMEENFITEDEAHQTLLKMSQDQSVPLKDVCLAMINTKNVTSKERPKKF